MKFISSRKLLQLEIVIAAIGQEANLTSTAILQRLLRLENGGYLIVESGD